MIFTHQVTSLVQYYLPLEASPKKLGAYSKVSPWCMLFSYYAYCIDTGREEGERLWEIMEVDLTK